jgi:hypothetical protein
MVIDTSFIYGSSVSSRSIFIGGVGGWQRLMRVYTYGLSVVRIRGSSGSSDW